LIGFGVGIDPPSYISFQSDKTATSLYRYRVDVYLFNLLKGSQEGNNCINCFGWSKEMVEFVEATGIFFERDDRFLATV
jgi:hypothetical protein